MGGLLGILIGLIAITFLPALVLGWLFKGWRPLLMSFGVVLFFLWAHPNVKLHIIATPIHYLVVLALYLAGGKFRTGKSEGELMGGAASE